MLRSTGTIFRSVSVTTRNVVSRLKVMIIVIECCRVFSLQGVIDFPCNMKFSSVSLDVSERGMMSVCKSLAGIPQHENLPDGVGWYDTCYLPDGVSWYVMTTVAERSEVTRVSWPNKKAGACSFFFKSQACSSMFLKGILTRSFRCRRMQRETSKRVKSMTGRAISSTSMAATGGGKLPRFVASRWVLYFNNSIINTWYVTSTRDDGHAALLSSVSVFYDTYTSCWLFA